MEENHHAIVNFENISILVFQIEILNHLILFETNICILIDYSLYIHIKYNKDLVKLQQVTRQKQIALHERVFTT